MKRFLGFSMAMLFALVGIALVGGDSDAMARGGCHGRRAKCHGVEASCHNDHHHNDCHSSCRGHARRHGRKRGCHAEVASYNTCCETSTSCCESESSSCGCSSGCAGGDCGGEGVIVSADTSAGEPVKADSPAVTSQSGDAPADL